MGRRSPSRGNPDRIADLLPVAAGDVTVAVRSRRQLSLVPVAQGLPARPAGSNTAHALHPPRLFRPPAGQQRVGAGRNHRHRSCAVGRRSGRHGLHRRLPSGLAAAQASTLGVAGRVGGGGACVLRRILARLSRSEQGGARARFASEASVWGGGVGLWGFPGPGCRRAGQVRHEGGRGQRPRGQCQGGCPGRVGAWIAALDCLSHRDSAMGDRRQPATPELRYPLGGYPPGRPCPRLLGR
jgi:hypothetical protein